MHDAARQLVDEHGAEHIDLNFGCPVRKVTRHGGGSALPWRRTLFAQVVAAAVQGAGDVPVTVKLRMGIDDDHLTYLDAGPIAEAQGAAAVALHARTAEQAYSGRADWDAIAGSRRRSPTCPVLGNGDIWVAADALRMVAETGCDGVVVGRGCLGRPWLFGDLAAAFDGRTATTRRRRSVGGGRHPARPRPAPGRVARRPRRREGHPQARRLVPPGLPGRPGHPPPARAGRHPRGVRGRPRRARPHHRAAAPTPSASPAATSTAPAPVTVPEGFWDDRDSPAPLGAGADAYTSGG